MTPAPRADKIAQARANLAAGLYDPDTLEGDLALNLTADKMAEDRDVRAILDECEAHDPDEMHDWQLDPEHRGEGLACTRCRVTEAELDHEE